MALAIAAAVGPLRRFTRAEEGRAGLIEYMNPDLVRNSAKAHDLRIWALPVRGSSR